MESRPIFCEYRFKYEPDALREAVLHPRSLLPPAVDSSSPRMRKRQRVDDEGGEDAMDMKVDGASSTIASPVWRGVELETAVERFLLRMYEAGAEADAEETGANAANGDAEGDAETIMPSAEDKQPQLQQQGGGESDRRRWEIWLLGTLDENENDRLQLPPSGVADVVDGGAGNASKEAGAVLLQRELCASNLEFVEGEVRVLQDAPLGADAETSSGAREGWVIEVRRWRWARS
jgi:hypothetical protein